MVRRNERDALVHLVGPGSRPIGVWTPSRVWAAKPPTARIARGATSSTCFRRYGSQDSISSVSGLRFPGGRHFSTLQI
jgi:hypothetical protein